MFEPFLTTIAVLLRIVSNPFGNVFQKQLTSHKYALLVICVGTMQLTTNYTFDHMPVGYALSLFQLSTIASVLLGHRIFKEKDILKKLIVNTIMVIGSVIIILFKDL